MHPDQSAPRPRASRKPPAVLALLLLAMAAAPAAAQGNAPAIAALNPAGATAGAGAFTLEVSGSNFRDDATVRWNGQTRTTTRIDDGLLRANISAGDVASAGTAQVTVHVPRGRGVTSPPANFSVAPRPVLGSVAPTRLMAGGDAVSLVVQGTGFAPGSRVFWAGSPRTTTGNATQLTAAIPPADLARARSVAITVVTAGPAGAASAPRSVAVVHETPQIASLTPSSAVQNGSGFELSVRGANFLRTGTTVRWNGSSRPTRYISPAEVRATIPASDLTTAGTARVEVRTQVDGSARLSSAAELEVRSTRVVVVATPVPTLFGVSSFQLRGGVPFATPGARVTLDVTTYGSPSLYRTARRQRGCATDLTSAPWRAYPPASPPTVDFPSVGRHGMCFQVARGTAASPTAAAPAEASIQVVPWRIVSPQMGSGSNSLVLIPNSPRDLIPEWSLGIGLDLRAGTLIDQIRLRQAVLGTSGERSGTSGGRVIGGTGGTAQRLVCPAGQAMVGVRGRHGLVLDRIEVACRPFGRDRGTHGSTTWIGPVGGSGGGSSYAFLCPPPHAVFDLGGDVTGSYVSGLQLICLPPAGL